VAATLRDNAVDGGKAQTRALARLLGGEEGLEEVGWRGRVHPDAGVAHRQPDIAPQYHPHSPVGIGLAQFHVCRLKSQPTALRHGIAGIHGQVQDHLL
jgi:hypothetical protein